MKTKRNLSRNNQQKRKRKAGRKVFPQLVGKVQMTREGFLFVTVEGQEEDIFVGIHKTRGALNGDTVRVAVTKTGKRREGEIVEIIMRCEKPFVGIYHMIGANAWVLMQSKSMPYDIKVDPAEAEEAGAVQGYKVAVRVDRWDRGETNPSGHIVDVLGEPGLNDTEMHAILSEFNLPYKFESEVENAADAISDKITASDLADRKDFRDVFTFTIDPADAKDFDDALSFRRLSNGNIEVGVHIADVSRYVTPGSPVDKEARERGTSVYLVDRTVPMLPEKLCNKLCSLRQGEDKLTFSAVFEMTPDAKVRRSWIGRTVICSNYRLNYSQAQSIIELSCETDASEGVSSSEKASLRSAPPSLPAGPLPLTLPRVACFSEEEHPSEAAEPINDNQLIDAIKTLNGMAMILKEKRRKAGAIDFERPEMKVECDANGKPIRIYQKFSCEANFLVEEFMLLANRTVANFVATKGKTFVYRIHDVPSPDKLDSLRSFAKGFGYKMSGDLEGRSAARSISELLHNSAGKPEYAAFQDIALRSMAKAKYSTDNIGHYGLAFADYTHFTSPIRRYPDLMVHRLLALYLSGAKSQDKDYFEAECVHASAREGIATDAERTSIKYKLVEYMTEHIGEEYDGQVSGVTEWGMYVEVEPTHIEGMVSLRTIKSDFFDFDEKHYCLYGRRTRRRFRLGDRVRIRVASANLEQRLLDFELVESDSNQNLLSLRRSKSNNAL